MDLTQLKLLVRQENMLWFSLVMGSICLQLITYRLKETNNNKKESKYQVEQMS